MSIKAWSTPPTDKDKLMTCWLHSIMRECSLNYCHKLAVRNEVADRHLCPSPDTSTLTLCLTRSLHRLTIILVLFFIIFHCFVGACTYMCVSTHMCQSRSVEVRRPLAGVISLLLPCSYSGPNFSHRVWQHLYPPHHLSGPQRYIFYEIANNSFAQVEFIQGLT